LNWIVKDKILAFAGPSFERNVSPEGYCTLSPADYIPYFQQKNIGLVVRLNKKNYHEQDFIDAGIDHLEAFFIDGSCPPMPVLERVVDAFEKVPEGKGFAVHCKAGLGRTGTCIGAYLMKHYRFTAAEVIGWMRLCRPGMVIGPQQHFLKKIERIMWQAGASEKISAHLLRSSVKDPREELMHSENDSDVEMSDAVVGRAGQADGLLSARSRRAVVTPQQSTPKTPEQAARDKAASVVTPDIKTRYVVR
jgi:protein-tyrosine phosphatase